VNNNSNLSQFSQGFSSGSDNTSLLLPLLLIVAVILGVLWFVYWLSRNVSMSKPKTRSSRLANGPARVSIVSDPNRINPLQQKVLFDMIDEFRKEETSAQGVPSAVLEKYSEFFLQNLKRLKTNESDVQEYMNQNFPLRADEPIELDFHSKGSMVLIKSMVLEVTPKSVLVGFSGVIPEFITKGTTVTVNYNVGKRFIQGLSQVIEIRPPEGLILRKPTQVSLTSERRYSRVSVTAGTGTLTDLKTGHHMAVKVLDLGPEGLRVQVERPLEKSHVHQLSFEASAGGKKWPFGPLECAPLKTFLSSHGTVEAGLAFLYLDLGTRSRLVGLMKTIAQEAQELRG